MNCKECGQKISSQASDDVAKKFEIFWEKYPRKLAKKNAFKVFMRIDPDEELFERILNTVAWNRKLIWHEHLITGDIQFIPHPTTWLNQERWEEDSPLSDVVKPTGPIIYPSKS